MIKGIMLAVLALWLSAFGEKFSLKLIALLACGGLFSLFIGYQLACLKNEHFLELLKLSSDSLYAEISIMTAYILFLSSLIASLRLLLNLKHRNSR